MKNTYSLKNWKGKVVGSNAITACGISVMTSSMLLVDFDSMREYPAAGGQKQEGFSKTTWQDSNHI